jgi:hypothetical protein
LNEPGVSIHPALKEQVDVLDNSLAHELTI